MKKIIIPLVFFLSVFCITPAIAMQNETYQNADDKLQNSINELCSKAKSKRNSHSSAIMINNANPNIRFEVPVYAVDSTEVTQTYTSDDVKSQTFFVDTKEAIPLSNESHYIDELDSTCSILANITIYYTTKGTPTQYLLTKVSGGYQIKDYSVSVTSQKVTFGCNGVFPSAINTQVSTKYPGSSTSWTYNTGFTQSVVNDITAAIGCNNILTLKHGGESVWTLHIFNNL